MIRRATVIVVAVMVALGAAGCGSEQGVSKEASAQLDASVQRIRVAAVTRDRAAADQALADLRGQVETLRAGGAVTRLAATRILDAATRVQAELAALPTTTTSTTTTTSPPPPTTDTENERGKKNDDKGKGREKDNGGGE